MKKKTLTLVFVMVLLMLSLAIILCPVISVLASSSEGWVQTYGGVSADCIIQTSDGGYAMLGSNSDNPDFLLVKTNSSGDLEWSKTYGSQDMDFGDDIVQTNDGGYVLGGFMWNRGDHNSMAGLVKTDSNGSMLWKKNYPGGTPLSMVNTTDGGYVLSSGLTLVKTDSEGNALWTKGVGSEGQARSVIQTRDGGYAVAGYASPPPSSEGQGWIFYAWIVKTDSEGNYPLHVPRRLRLLPHQLSPAQTESPSPTVPEFAPAAAFVFVTFTCITAFALRGRRSK